LFVTRRKGTAGSGEDHPSMLTKFGKKNKTSGFLGIEKKKIDEKEKGAPGLGKLAPPMRKRKKGKSVVAEKVGRENHLPERTLKKQPPQKRQKKIGAGRNSGKVHIFEGKIDTGERGEQHVRTKKEKKGTRRPCFW